MEALELPLGKYTATATWAPENKSPVKLLIRTKGAKTYSESVTLEFTDPMKIKMYMAEFEVKFPN